MSTWVLYSFFLITGSRFFGESTDNFGNHLEKYDLTLDIIPEASYSFTIHSFSKQLLSAYMC